jgi:biotin transport system substrate-specific component
VHGGITVTTSARVARPAPPAVLADAIPAGASGTTATLRTAALVVGGALVTALAAQVSFTAPGMVVPFTGQTAAVLLTGAALGWRRGAASMALYVAAGALGAPIFSKGASGLAEVFGVTGGYLAGFILAAAVVGALAARGWDRTIPRAATLMVLGNLLIYAIGVPVLAAVTGQGIGWAIANGALPFVPWDALKIALAAGLLPATWLLVGRRR